MHVCFSPYLPMTCFACLSQHAPLLPGHQRRDARRVARLKKVVISVGEEGRSRPADAATRPRTRRWIWVTQPLELLLTTLRELFGDREESRSGGGGRSWLREREKNHIGRNGLSWLRDLGKDME